MLDHLLMGIVIKFGVIMYSQILIIQTIFYNLVYKSTMQKLQLKDLFSALKNQQTQIANKNLQSSQATEEFLITKSQKVDELPLKKQLQLKRQSTYRATQQQADKWIGIVKLNRQKDSLNFVKNQKDNAANVTFFPSTPLNDFHGKIEGQLKQMEIQSQGAVMKKQQNALETISKQDAKDRLKEARQQRTIVFNEEIKRRRIAKIKSKLYHKIKKRQKLRQQSKRIQGMDGEQRNQYLQKLAKQRIHERITLRHKSKNKYIQDLLRFNKGNKNSIQQSINEINQIRRKQLEKVNETFLEKMSQEYDEENYREEALKDLQKEIDQMEHQQDSVPKKGLDGMKFMKLGRQKELKQSKSEASKLIHILDNQQDIEDKEFQSEMQQESQEKELTKKKFGESNPTPNSNPTNQNYLAKNLKGYLQNNSNINDLTEGININKLKQKYQPNRVDLDLRQAISQNKEIFNVQNIAVQDNYKEFQSQKFEDYEADLPTENKKQKGWGSWAGPGITEQKIDHALQVRKKLAKIAEIKRKRRDGQLQGVIVRQSYNKNLKDYFVNKVPHNYKSAQQFDYMQDEKIGSEWNTLNQFNANIKPKVITKVGQVIEAVKLPKYLQKGGKR